MLNFNRTVIKTAVFTLSTVSALLSFGANAELKPGFINEDFVVDALWHSEFAEHKDEAIACPEMPEPLVTFSSGSIYKDTPCNCEIDPESYASYQAEVESIKDYMETLIKLKDDYLTFPGENQDAAICIMDNIEHWAANNAMLGAHEDTVGYHKTADLIGITAEVINTLRRNEILANYDMVLIEDWLNQGAYNVIEYYKYSAGGRTRVNNHRYWDSLSVARASVVTQNKELFNWATEGLAIGLHQIDDQGLLPRELQRGSRASKYHVFASMPLVTLAELTIKNRDLMKDGFYPYAYNDSALHRLMANMTELAYSGYNKKIGQSYTLSCGELTMFEIYSNHISGHEGKQMKKFISARSSSRSSGKP